MSHSEILEVVLDHAPGVSPLDVKIMRAGKVLGVLVEHLRPDCFERIRDALKEHHAGPIVVKRRDHLSEECVATTHHGECYGG